MTRDLDRIPVSQASPLELLRMLWRLWRGRHANPLVLTPFGPAPGTMRAWVGFAAAAAMLGTAASFLSGDTLRAVMASAWASPLPFAAPPCALLVIAAWAMVLVARKPSGLMETASLESLRTTGLSDREIVFGMVLRALRGLPGGTVLLLAAATLPALAGFADLAVRASGSGRVQPDIEDALRAFGAIAALAALWIGGPATVVAAAESILAPGEPYYRAARRILLCVAHALGVALLAGLAWLIWHLRSIRLVYMSGEFDMQMMWPRIAADTASMAACSLVAVLLVLEASVRRAALHASSRLFGPVDPDHLRRVWWRAAAEEEDAAPARAVRRGLVPALAFALACAGITGPLVASWRFAAPAENQYLYAQPRLPRLGETQEIRIRNISGSELTSVSLSYYVTDPRGSLRFTEHRPFARGEAPGEWALRHVPLQAQEELGFYIAATPPATHPGQTWLLTSLQGSFVAVSVDLPRWLLLPAGIAHPGNAAMVAVAVALLLAWRLRPGELPARRAHRWAWRMVAPVIVPGVLPLCVAWLWVRSPMEAEELVSACIQAALACIAASLLGVLALLGTVAAERRAPAMLAWGAAAAGMAILSGHEAVERIFADTALSGSASPDVFAILAASLVLYTALRDRALQRIHDITALQREPSP